MLVTTSKYLQVHIFLKLLTSTKLTQFRVNINSLFHRQIVLNEHSQWLTLLVTREVKQLLYKDTYVLYAEW